MDIIANPGKEVIRGHMNDYLQVPRGAVLKTLATFTVQAQASAVRDSRGKAQPILPFAQGGALAVAMVAGLGDNLAAAATARAPRPEAQQSGSVMAATAAPAGGAGGVAASRRQTGALAAAAVKGAIHLDYRLSPAQGGREGDLQIVAKVGPGGLPQTGRTAGDSKKFLKKLIIFREPGTPKILAGGSRALAGLLDSLVSLRQLPEADAGLGIVRVVVRVVLAGQGPVALADLCQGGVGGYSQNAVTIPDNHGQS
jgi:hypothetical protein